MRTWEHIMHIKKDGAKNFALRLFNAFKKTTKEHAVSAKEAEELKAFGTAMKKCVEEDNFKSIARELLRMTLHHFMKLYEIK